MGIKQQAILASDRATSVLVPLLVVGGVAAFGGAVWWFRPAATVIAFLLAAIQTARFLLTGQVLVLKSPLAACWLAALALALFQLVPLPARLAELISPRAHAIYARGAVPELVARDNPRIEAAEPAYSRSPASLDRSATLRWLGAAAAALAVFWSVAHFTDRLRRLYLVMGSVIAAFLLNGAVGIVNLSCGVEGMFGFVHAGGGQIWAPTYDDLLDSPTVAIWRTPETSTESNQPGIGIVLAPERPRALGTMMGGPGALLALGSLALPVALAVLLHMIAPGGSRESLTTRLRQTRRGSLVVLTTALLVPTCYLVGFAAGTGLCWVFITILLVVGVPSSFVPGSRLIAPTLTAVLTLAILVGAGSSGYWSRLTGSPPPVPQASLAEVRELAPEARAVLGNFPLVGVGLGGFPVLHPYLKARDDIAAPRATLLQFLLESGLAGAIILAVAAGWCLWRLPWALRKVGATDWTLAQGLLGAGLGFTLWTALQWTVDLPAVAISASALLGAGNRFLAGGVDLFVDRG